jgi:hypothetical protein
MTAFRIVRNVPAPTRRHPAFPLRTVPLQQFHLVREHVLALMTSERFAGTLPVVPGTSLAASDAAQTYLLRRPLLRLPAPAGSPDAGSDPACLAGPAFQACRNSAG